MRNSVGKIKEQWLRLQGQPGFAPLIFLLLAILSYGLLIPWLHLYMDDWLWAWTWDKMGPAGLVRYFSTNRPIWGMLFQVTLPLLGSNPIAYQVFALLVRLASGFACWWFLRLLWPKRLDWAFWGAFIFLTYPGFVLQSIALTYSHIFLIYTAFLLSLIFQALAIRKTRQKWVYHLLALIFSLVNLLSMEYFFTLELARPIFVWILLDDSETSRAKRLRGTALQWVPYLILWIGVVIWRTFFFKFQTYNYSLSLLKDFQAQPFSTLLSLLKTILVNLFETSFGAWLPAINRLVHLSWKQATSLLTLAIGVLAFFLSLAGVQRFRQARNGFNRSQTLQMIAFGLLIMLLSGIPFWLTKLEVEPILLHSRLTLPFILGAVFVLLGVLELIQARYRFLVLALMIAVAAGAQFQNANDFRVDWSNNRQMMWQVFWRIPNMREGTTLLLSDLTMNFFGTQELANTAALSTQLNYIYSEANQPPDLSYYLLFAREADRGLPGGLQKNTPILENNVTAVFSGSTNQVLAASYSAGRCFRLLDPAMDAADQTQSEPIRKAAALSDWKWVSTTDPDQRPPVHLFGKEPAHGWCYFYEKGELARQQGNWEKAAQFGNMALSAGFQPRDLMEGLGFIEAFARTGQWVQAVRLSSGFPTDKQPVLCQVWKRIAGETRDSPQKSQSVTEINQANHCSE